MRYCGESFDNSLEVAGHNAESHKEGYTCGYERGTGPLCHKSYDEKSKMWRRVCCAYKAVQ